MKMRRIRLVLIGVLLLLAGGLGYIYAVYNGFILLNNPSGARYPVRGVDVSHYQGEIDWQVLSQENIDFAYIKATEGSSHVDDKFAANWELAKQTDLVIGAYHFFSFDSPGETQAVNFISQVERLDGALPPVIDVEYYGDKKVHPPDPAALRRELQVMLDRLEEHYGRPPVIYSTEDVWGQYLAGYFDAYPLWIRNVLTKPRIREPWLIWQFTNRARLDGYSGEETFIDVNVFRGSREDWDEWR